MENFELLKALFLGLIEGLTEFLPISSTGHLILFGHIIDFHSDAGRAFEVVIQLGAIMAVVVIFWHKIMPLRKNSKGQYKISKPIFDMCKRILLACKGEFYMF